MDSRNNNQCSSVKMAALGFSTLLKWSPCLYDSSMPDNRLLFLKWPLFYLDGFISYLLNCGFIFIAGFLHSAVMHRFIACSGKQKNAEVCAWV